VAARIASPVPSPPVKKGGEQLRTHAGERRPLGSLAHHDRRAGPLRKDAFMEAVEFPDEAFQPISRDRAADALPGRDAHLAPSASQGVTVHRKMRGVDPRPFPDHLPELAVRTKPLPGGEPVRALPARAGHFFPLTVTVRRFRPFARRRARTFRPAAVDIRSRNPWVRFRRRLCGW
jgi:hypothetical protein